MGITCVISCLRKKEFILGVTTLILRYSSISRYCPYIRNNCPSPATKRENLTHPAISHLSRALRHSHRTYILYFSTSFTYIFTGFPREARARQLSSEWAISEPKNNLYTIKQQRHSAMHSADLTRNTSKWKSFPALQPRASVNFHISRELRADIFISRPNRKKKVACAP